MKEDRELPSLDALGADINRLQAKAKPPAEQITPEARANSIGMRVGMEMVSSVLVGLGLGYLLDSWWGTSPLMLVICLLLGAAAGFLTIYRTAFGTDDTKETMTRD